MNTCCFAFNTGNCCCSHCSCRCSVTFTILIPVRMMHCIVTCAALLSHQNIYHPHLGSNLEFRIYSPQKMCNGIRFHSTVVVLNKKTFKVP